MIADDALLVRLGHGQVPRQPPLAEPDVNRAAAGRRDDQEEEVAVESVGVQVRPADPGQPLARVRLPGLREVHAVTLGSGG